MNPRELPKDRLATTDEEGNRVYLYPADVKGRFRNLREKFNVLLVVIFIGLPWAKIGGQPAILLNIPRRQFTIFGINFWAHDAPMLVFILGGAVISLAFVTAVWGRIWCGWACPQTVFVEGLFRKIERWIEGDGVERRRLDLGPFTVEKAFKKFIKWSLFTVFALIISHSFLSYFVGMEELGRMIRSNPSENLPSFLIMAFVTGGILFDFGWFREQFCTIVCPYGRFQSVLMDQHSLVVAYDQKRGEPRKGMEANGKPQGDCVNCYRCVHVCPTGIDIRRGVQLECVACTSCIDACDEVMHRLGKPKGLIRYDNLAMSEGKTLAFVPWYKRARALVYFSILIVIISGLTYLLKTRKEIDFELIRSVGAPFEILPSENGEQQIINHFKVDLQNQSFQPRKITFELSDFLKEHQAKIILSNHKEELPGGESERADLFVQFPKSILSSGQNRQKIFLKSENLTLEKEVPLVGPVY